MEFKTRIGELRKQYHLTQEELAEKLYVNRSLISKWENGTRFPGVDDLKNISSVFGISMDELVFDNVQSQETSVNTVSHSNGEKRIEIVFLSVIIALIAFRIIVDIFATYLELDSFLSVILHFCQETIWDIFIIIYALYRIIHEDNSHEVPSSIRILSITLIGKIVSLFIAHICLYLDFGDLKDTVVGFILYSLPSFLLLCTVWFYLKRTSFDSALALKIGLVIYIVFYIVRFFCWGPTFTAHLAFYLSRSIPEIVISAVTIYEIHRYYRA